MRLEMGSSSARGLLLFVAVAMAAIALHRSRTRLSGAGRAPAVNVPPALALDRTASAPPAIPRPPAPAAPLRQTNQPATRAPAPVAPVAARVETSRVVSNVQKQQDEALAQWAREPDDANATLELNDHIEESLRDLELQGKLLGLSCRTSLCRLQMQFPTLADAQRFSQQAGTPERRKRLDVRIDEEEGFFVDAIVARP